MKFVRRITKNGNSLQVTIPPQVIDVMRLTGRDALLLEMPDVHTLTIRRVVAIELQDADVQPMTLDTTIPGAR